MKLTTRERFFQGEILNIGEMITESLQILDRRANHIVAIDSSGKLSHLNINEAFELQNGLIDIRPIPHSYQGIPECLQEALEQRISGFSDQYSAALCIRGISVLKAGKGSQNLLDAVQSKIGDIDLGSIVLKENGVTKSDLVRLIDSNYFVLTESIEDCENRLKRLKPDDVEHLADKVKDFEDIAHLYDDDEVEHKIDEHITRLARIHKKISFERSEAKRERARAIAVKRLSSNEKLKRKASRAAIELIKEKIAHKKLDQMGIEEKERLEDMVAKRTDLVSRLAQKLLPKIRQIEQKRVYHQDHLEEGMKRTDDADDDESVVVIDGKNVIRVHPSGAVYSNGGRDVGEIAV
jgi:hypothetical protein